MKQAVDPIRLIFGLKLKQFRQNKGWSLQEFSEKTGISPSYINEIEKGKKYPKTDKILVLARILEIDYDELISTDLRKALGPTGDLLKSSFFTDIPFEFFGIDPGNIIEIIADAPVKFSAFVNTLIKIGRSYNVSVEKLYFAVLRSFLEIHKNYFPELEEIADKFYPETDKTEASLKKYLREEHKLFTDTFNPEKSPAISHLRTVLKPKSKKLFLNQKLSKDQRTFALAREAGFRYMGIRVRPLTSTWVSVNSFDEVFNNFKASYFAACILIPKTVLNKDLGIFFEQAKFSHKRLAAILGKFEVSSETAYYRMFSLLPAYFNIEKLYFLKFESLKGAADARLVKEIHLVGQHDPQESRNEHYCRRWSGISILDDVENSKDTAEIFKPQISVFENLGHQYFEIAIGKPSKNQGQESITLGFEINDITKKQVGFIDDPKVAKRSVGQTCEKCGIFDCKERVASPSVLYKQRRLAEVKEAIEELN
jgi:transcriptional regulator with XRE-family HTH domain